MLADQTSHKYLTKIEITQTPLYHQIQILNSLRENLVEFSKIYRSTTEPEELPIRKEDYITNQVERFLNKKNEGYLFEMQSQCGPDLHVIIFKTFNLHEAPIFVIEAKRLRKSSGMDYVKGKTGGIERFKRQKHGRTFNVAAMLGYVEEETFSYWHEKVNSWIEFLINSGYNDSLIVWEEKDKLSEVAISEIGEYKSVHKRNSIQTIVLHHFWLNFCNN